MYYLSIHLFCRLKTCISFVFFLNMSNICVFIISRSLRSVPKGKTDKLASDADILLAITKLLSAFHHGNDSISDSTSRARHSTQSVALQNLVLMKEVFGFTVERCTSSIAGGGRGVKVTAGCIPEGAVTSLYPGKAFGIKTLKNFDSRPSMQNYFVSFSVLV